MLQVLTLSLAAVVCHHLACAYSSVVASDRSSSFLLPVRVCACVQFLNTLERHFKSLASGTLSSVSDTLPSLLNGLRLVWTISRHYSTDDTMLPLMKRIVNELTDKVSNSNKHRFSYAALVLAAAPTAWGRDCLNLVTRITRLATTPIHPPPSPLPAPRRIHLKCCFVVQVASEVNIKSILRLARSNPDEALATLKAARDVLDGGFDITWRG